MPKISNKAIAVIGMRRAGKTSFLHQCLRDFIAQGRRPRSLVYFNFKDERLGGLLAANLHKVLDVHARLFPPSADEKVVFFFDEIQLVSGWEQFCRRLLDSGSHEIFVSGSSSGYRVDSGF